MKRYPITPAWAQAIDRWTLALAAAGRTGPTIETRTEHLRRFSRQTHTPSPALVTRTRVIEWAGAHDWARETRRSVYASLRGFYRWAVEVGVCGDDPTDVLPAVKPGPACPRPAPEDVYAEAIRTQDARARVILRLAGEAGLRRGEIAVVAREDLIRDLSGISLIVHGKGKRDRRVPLSDSLAREVVGYLGEGRYLLPSPTGGHLTPRHVGKIGAGVLPQGYTLHTLRHRFATTAHAGTRDLIVVQRLLGHSSVATTQRYVASSDDAMRQAVIVAAV